MSSHPIQVSLDGKMYTFHKACNMRDSCRHRKHGYRARKAQGLNGYRWPIPEPGRHR